MAVQEYYLPRSLEQALGLIAEHGPSLLVMAGGTIVMPLVNEGVSLPERVMGLRFAGLDSIRKDNGTMLFGAAATLTHVGHRDEIPLLQQATHNIGGWQIRNMGTIGGNLFVPPPAGDLAVALLALDSRVKLVGPRGERVVPLCEFYTGFLSTDLAPGELVTELQVPLPRGSTHYVKYSRKHANTPAIVTVAVNVTFDGRKVAEARIALNAVGPHPSRARRAETVLLGAPLDEASIREAAKEAAGECEPFTDAIATDWYRRRMVEVFVRRALGGVARQE